METLRMSSVVFPNVEYVLCVPPMVCGLHCRLQSGLVYLFWAVVFGSDWCIAHPCLVGKPAMVVVRVQGPSNYQGRRWELLPGYCSHAATERSPSRHTVAWTVGAQDEEPRHTPLV
jgi:hypothetical protein